MENAIKYGFDDIFEGGIIRISAGEEEDFLILTVANNGTPMHPFMAKRLNELAKAPVPEMKNYFPDKKHGYGIVNIATRLRLKYGEAVSFYYEINNQKTAAEGGTEAWTSCIIKIPKEGAGNNESKKT